MYLKKLLQSVDGLKVISPKGVAWETISVSGLCDDSRCVKHGDLFFCKKGANFDSHTLASEVLKKGAVAVVCERELAIPAVQIVAKDCREATALIANEFYARPAEKLKIIGITGTNGKTTTAYMLSSILKRAGKSVGIIGTLGVYYAHKKIAPELTTPDPLFLQETLADMAALGVEYVVMEVSAHALHYKKDAGIHYAACIFTNCTQDHLDFFSTMRRYSETKKTLFTVEKCPLAILNADDPLGLEIGEEFAGETLYYGLETPAHAFAVITGESLHGTELMLNVKDRLKRVSLQLAGRHNVYNALAAATCAQALGFTMTQISSGLSTITRVKGRLEAVEEWNGAKIFVDFAHTPDGLQNSLSALKRHCRGKLVCLFGCGGNRDKEKRPLMGEAVAKTADFAILTSDNPRYEDPMDIISGIEKGYRPVSTKYVIVPERERAVEYAIGMLKEGDILLVAGKGGEDYQEIMGIKYLLNDNDLIKKTIKEKGENAPL